MRGIIFALLFLNARYALAEEPPAFMLSSGVTLVEHTNGKNGAAQSVRVRKVRSGREVFVHASLPCAGTFADPWLSVGSGSATLVIEKRHPSPGFSANDECMYEIKLLVAAERLQAKETLYVVAERVVVGHATVP